MNEKASMAEHSTPGQRPMFQPTGISLAGRWNMWRGGQVTREERGKTEDKRTGKWNNHEKEEEVGDCTVQTSQLFGISAI